MKHKIVVFISILIIVAGILTYNYIYKEHRNIAEEEALFSDKALNFHSNFVKNTDRFNTKHLDKVVEIEGKITEIDETSLVLDDKVYVLFKDTLNAQIILKSTQTVKGRYVGYDDLLEVLKIDQATIIDK
ncbi:OB-fold protein [Aureibaculum conchae]|uniref:OB-fold protein n=1 Tax=Aureibaculum sp. 2308TA14-22 TaxID=3108392 RepID=UPI003392D79F